MVVDNKKANQPKYLRRTGSPAFQCIIVLHAVVEKRRELEVTIASSPW